MNIIKQRMMRGESIVHLETESSVVKHNNTNLDTIVLNILNNISTLNTKVSNLENDSSEPSTIQTASSWEEACQKRLEAAMSSWKPVSSDNVYRIPFTGSSNTDSTKVYKSGTTYYGIPYSSTRLIDKYIGYNVSFKSFFSCVNNKYTKLYTENLDGTNSRSAHGETYYANTCGPFMGTHCTAFVAYVLGMPIYWLSHQYGFSEKMGYFVYKGLVRADKVKKWDVIFMPGHAKLVINVYKDASGNIKIDTVEAAGNEGLHYNAVIQTSGYNTASYGETEFNQLFCANDFDLYRVSLTHELSLEYETDYKSNFNDYFTTIEGDNATFRKGSNEYIKLAVKNKGSFTKVRILKNNSIVAWKNASPWYYSTTEWTDVSTDTITYTTGSLSSTDNNYIDISNRVKNSAGLYRVRLEGGSNPSSTPYVYFEVVDTTVSCTKISTNKYKIEFSSIKDGIPTSSLDSTRIVRQGRPVYVDFIEKSVVNGESITKGNVIVRWLLTPEEILNGYAEIDTAKLAKWQTRGGLLDSADYGSIGFVKVMFKTEYGHIASKNITVPA